MSSSLPNTVRNLFSRRGPKQAAPVTIATLAVLSAFRAIEYRLPSEFYAHHHLRFKREAVMAEDKLRQLVGNHPLHHRQPVLAFDQ